MAEIKISELSIGDWVRHTFYEENLQIKRIDGESERLLVEKGLMSVSCHLDHFEPIPLTPEILEKNGISKTYESDEYAVYKGEGFNVTEYYTELWEFERHRNRLMIRNVHQLQHALRLAGVGKEIEV